MKHQSQLNGPSPRRLLSSPRTSSPRISWLRSPRRRESPLIVKLLAAAVMAAIALIAAHHMAQVYASALQSINQ